MSRAPSHRFDGSIPVKSIISISGLSKTYASGFQALKADQPGHPARRDLRAARPERRRQDHADQHRLRHRQCVGWHGDGGRPRHHPRLPRGARADRPRAAGADHRRLRDRLGDGAPSAAACSASRPIPPISRRCSRTLSLWDKKGRQDHDAVRRHEAPRADRQGAVARAATSCSSTSRPRASTSSCARTCGRWCASCAPPASPSS